MKYSLTPGYFSGKKDNFDPVPGFTFLNMSVSAAPKKRYEMQLPYSKEITGKVVFHPAGTCRRAAMADNSFLLISSFTCRPRAGCFSKTFILKGRIPVSIPY
jgi:hypothetical protein